MASISFDTLTFTRILDASGMPPEQAAAIAEAFREATNQLAWVLDGWPGTQPAVVIDATSWGDLFVVLAVSVVYRSCAVPIAWKVLRGGAKHAWKPEWQALLEQLRGLLPARWTELVLANRGRHYQAGSLIVSVSTDPTSGDPSIVPTIAPALTRELSVAATWEKYDGRAEDWVLCDPPTRHAAILFDAQSFRHLTPLAGVVRQPYFLEKLNRYETHLDRKVERTLAMLLKLKDLRGACNATT